MSDEKTPPDGPFAIAMQRLLERHSREIRAEIARLVEEGNARTAQLIGNALGVWRHEVDSAIAGLTEDHARVRLDVADHESRIRHIERAIRHAKGETEPPKSPNGVQ